MANSLYTTPTESSLPQRASQIAIFFVALLLVVGLTQFIAPPFDSEPEYTVTLRDGFPN